MPEVVSDTTPLQYLHQSGELRVLPELYGTILIPRAVGEEIRVGLANGVDLPDPEKLGWIEVREVPSPVWPIPRDIHRGEAEVIALAGNLTDPLMILDDLAARRHARLLGLRFTGTLGILLKARQAGLLDAVRPVVDRLEAAGFRLAETTRLEFLRLAGED